MVPWVLHVTVIMALTLFNVAMSDDTMMDNITEETSNTSVESPPGCLFGCLTCSQRNGCIQCLKNFIFHVEKRNMATIGVCLRSCPSGYYVKEFDYAPGNYACMKCESANCQVCQANNTIFCETCEKPFLEYRGSCILECPENLHYSKYRKDCHTQVDCLVNSWTEWSGCLHKDKDCNYKRGNRTRTREVLQHPSFNGNSCPSLMKSQKCKLAKQKPCELDNKVLSPEKSKRKRRHRKLRKALCNLENAMKQTRKACTGEDNFIRESEPSQIETGEDKYNYYRQSAELVKLLAPENSNRRHKGQKRKNKEPG